MLKMTKENHNKRILN